MAERVQIFAEEVLLRVLKLSEDLLVSVKEIFSILEREGERPLLVPHERQQLLTPSPVDRLHSHMCGLVDAVDGQRVEPQKCSDSHDPIG